MADVKWSQFPSAIPGNSDEVVGLKSGGNVLFSIANIVAAVRNGLASIFVPLTRTINGKGLSTDISLDSSDIDYDNTQSGLTATDVQEAIDELAQGGGGGGSAADITYDPTTSGLSATNVQDAIDEAVDDLDGKANQTQLGYPESGTTATKAGGYTTGEYISWQGTLYTANTNIAYGTTLSAGTGGNLTECAGGGFNDRSTGTVGRGTMTSGTILSASLVRWGRVVVCTCQLYGLSGINRADCVPFRMPEGFRPTSDTNIQLVFNDGNNGKQWITYGTLKSDGYVSANNAVLGSFAPLVTAIQIQSAVWLI